MYSDFQVVTRSMNKLKNNSYKSIHAHYTSTGLHTEI